MSDVLVVTRDSRGVASVVLNRPQARNALSKQLNGELAAVAGELDADPEVKVVTLTGAGDRAFCAGADLKERKGVDAAASQSYVDAIGTAINAWARMSKVTLGVINGFAFGGGMELALACDLRIACDEAVMALTEVRLGIMPGAGGTQRLPRLIGVAAAKELILLGRRISAERARELGIVSSVVARAKLQEETESVVRELLECAPVSVARAKEAIDRGIDVGMDEGLRIERDCYNVTLMTEDRNEGLRAFAAKRPPQFQGR